MLNGLFVNIDTASRSAILRVLQSFSISRYGLEIMMVTELEGLDTVFDPAGLDNVKVKGDVWLRTLAFDVNGVARDLRALVVLCTTAYLVHYVGLRCRRD